MTAELWQALTVLVYLVAAVVALFAAMLIVALRFFRAIAQKVLRDEERSDKALAEYLKRVK